jgi:hypothetical protein
VRYPVVRVTGKVVPYENGRGFEVSKEVGCFRWQRTSKTTTAWFVLSMDAENGAGLTVKLTNAVTIVLILSCTAVLLHNPNALNDFLRG